MDGLTAIIAGGVLLGLAGSLHCACMCGGIASGAIFLLRPQTPAQRLAALIGLQAGRITTYALAGGLVASVLSTSINPELTAGSFRALQWAAAVLLMWIGLTNAGLLPRVASLSAGSAAITAFADKALAPLRQRAHLGPFALGLSWGLTPCPMVYAALFSAMLTGSFANGALWMLSFGAGTLPGVLGSSLGITWLSSLRANPVAEVIGGVLIAAFGFLTLYTGWMQSALICAPR